MGKIKPKHFSRGSVDLSRFVVKISVEKLKNYNCSRCNQNFNTDASVRGKGNTLITVQPRPSRNSNIRCEPAEVMARLLLYDNDAGRIGFVTIPVIRKILSNTEL